MPEPETDFAIRVEIQDIPDIGVRIFIVDPLPVTVKIDPLK